MALYNWCRVNYDEEHILSQKDLLQGDIIANKDPSLLLRVTQSLLDERLFRTHELRSGGIGWKIVSHVSAEKCVPPMSLSTCRCTDLDPTGTKTSHPTNPLSTLSSNLLGEPGLG